MSSFNWAWAGLMILLLWVCLCGGSLFYSVVFAVWFCCYCLEGPLSRGWVVMIVTSALVQITAAVAVNIAAAWSAAVRVWAFGNGTAASAFAVGPLLVKGVFGVRDWCGPLAPPQGPRHAFASADLTQDDTNEDGESSWQLSLVSVTLVPTVVLIAYVVACHRWLSRRTAASPRHAPFTALVDEQSELDPLLRSPPTSVSARAGSTTSLPSALSQSTQPQQRAQRRGGSPWRARWRRWLRVWSLILMALCAWQSWERTPFADGDSGARTSSHALLFEVPLEVAALLSWWTLCCVVPQALRARRRLLMAVLGASADASAHEHCERAARTVSRALYATACVVALPAMALAVARNAAVRDVLVQSFSSTALHATLGVSETLPLTRACRLFILFVLALLGAALRTRWHQPCPPASHNIRELRAATTTPAGSSVRESQRSAERGHRASRRHSRVPSLGAAGRVSDSAVTTPRGTTTTAATATTPIASVTRDGMAGDSPAPRRAPPQQPPAQDAGHGNPRRTVRGDTGQQQRTHSLDLGWLTYAWLPCQAVLWPSLPSALAATAYLHTLCRTTSDGAEGGRSRRAAATGSLPMDSERFFTQLAILALGLALCAQSAALSLALWLPQTVQDALWTAAWWPLSAGCAWQAAQHSALLVVFCLNISTAAPDAAETDTCDGNTGTVTADGVPSRAAATAAPLESTRAIRVLGVTRYNEIIAFAQRAEAITTDIQDSSHDGGAGAVDRLNRAFEAWLGRRATPLEQRWLAHRLPASWSVEAFTSERAVMATTALAYWWSPLRVVPEAMQQLAWRTAPGVLVLGVVTLATSLCDAHTHLIALVLATAALACGGAGWLDYGVATTHVAARGLLLLCATSFYACLGVSYVTLLRAPQHDPDSTRSTPFCEVLELLGLQPLRLSLPAFAPFLIALFVLQVVHKVGQRCGELRTWHDVLTRVEWQRATASAQTSNASFALSLPTHILRISVVLGVTLWLSHHDTFYSATTTQLLWCGWSVIGVTVATGCRPAVRAVVRGVMRAYVLAVTAVIAVAQLPSVQTWWLNWLSASTPRCAESTASFPRTRTQTDALSPPWLCLRQLGLYFFDSAPPPSACTASTRTTSPASPPWELQPLLLPWCLLCAAAAVMPSRRVQPQEEGEGETTIAPPSLSPPTCARDVPVLFVTSAIVMCIGHCGRDWLWHPLRRLRLPLLWLGLIVASASVNVGGILRLPYAVCFLLDLPALLAAVYSVLYAVALCAYQLPWVPAINATVPVSSWWWRPPLTNTTDRQPVIVVEDLLGLHKSPSPSSSFALLACPLLVLVLALPALMVASRQRRPPATATMTTTATTWTPKTWLDFFFSSVFFTLVGFELIIFWLLMLVWQLQSHALGLAVLACLVVVWRGGRDAYATPLRLPRCMLWLTMAACFGAASAKLLHEAIFVDIDSAASSSPSPSPVLVSSSAVSWRAWWDVTSLCTPRAQLLLTAPLVACAHLSARAADLLTKDLDKRRAALGGTTSLFAYIVQALPVALAMLRPGVSGSPTTTTAATTTAPLPNTVDETEARTRQAMAMAVDGVDDDVARVYLPALPPAAFHHVVPDVTTRLDPHTYTARLSRALIYIVGYTSPFVFLSFVSGAVGSPSLLHVVFMVSALMAVTFMEMIQWRAYIWWSRLTRAYVVLMVVVPVLAHIPVIEANLAAHEGFFLVLGFLESTKPATSSPGSPSSPDGADVVVVPVALTCWAVAAVFAVCVEGRALDDVWCTAYLRRLYRAYGKRRARYDALQARIADDNEREVAAVHAYDAELRQRLATMRGDDAHHHEPLIGTPAAAAVSGGPQRDENHQPQASPIEAAVLTASTVQSASSPLWGRESFAALNRPASPPFPTLSAFDTRLVMAIDRLAQHTYRPETVRVNPTALGIIVSNLNNSNDSRSLAYGGAPAGAAVASHDTHTQYLLWRLLVALYRVAESHTVVLVVLTAMANCLVTGAAFELVGLGYVVLVALPWYPHPPQAIYQWYALYITVGILLKAAVSLLAARVTLSADVLNWLSWTLVHVTHTPHVVVSNSASESPAATTATYTSTVTYTYVVMDFLEFTALTLHHYASVWNGVYRGPLVDQGAAEAVTAEQATGAARHEEPTPEDSLTPSRTSRSRSDEEDHMYDGDSDGEEEDIIAEEEEDEYVDVEEAEWAGAPALCAALTKQMQRHLGTLYTYWTRMTSTIAMGTDTYTIYTCLDAVALIFIIFAYSGIASSEYTSLQDNVRNNMVPGGLVLIITASTLQLVVERMLYVRRAMGLKVLLTVSTTIGYCGVYCWWRHTMAVRHRESNTVTTAPNRHATDALADGDRPLARALAGIYFALKMAASMASVTQIRKGFPRRRPHDCFTGHPESLTLYACHAVFRAVPFLWECRVLIDWTVSRTSLTLDSFLKVEDVYDTIYLRRVQLAGLFKRLRPVGTPIPHRTKVLVGLSRLVMLLAALLAPLLYYSTLNPAVQANPVTELEVSFSFNGARPFYSSLVQSPDNSTTVTTLWRQYFSRTRPSLATYGALLSANDVQRLEMTTCSEELWLISPTAQKRLEEALENAVAPPPNSTNKRIVSPSRFTRPRGRASSAATTAATTASPVAAAPAVAIIQSLRLSRGSAEASGSSSSTLSWMTRWELPIESAAQLLTAIRNTTVITHDTNTNMSESQPAVQLPFFYTPFISNRDASVSAFQPDTPSQSYRNRLNCSLQLRLEAQSDTASEAAPPLTNNSHSGGTVRYWCMSCEPFFTGGDFPYEDAEAYPEWACLTNPTFSPACVSSFNFEDAALGTLQEAAWQRHQNTSEWLAPRYVTISPPVVVKLPFLSGLGIVALYTTFVLALGRLLRSWFSSKAMSVIQTDMANPAPVSQLLACLYTARECGELELEETAYLELIDLLRSPERLLAVTGHVQDLHQQLANLSMLAPPTTTTAAATATAGDEPMTAELQTKKKA